MGWEGAGNRGGRVEGIGRGGERRSGEKGRESGLRWERIRPVMETWERDQRGMEPGSGWECHLGVGEIVGGRKVGGRVGGYEGEI